MIVRRRRQNTLVVPKYGCSHVLRAQIKEQACMYVLNERPTISPSNPNHECGELINLSFLVSSL